MDLNLERARILIVEDEKANLILLERILQRAGYSELRSTQDPREALRLFEGFRPDLVCTDLHMPHLSGLELIAELSRRIPAETYLPIVMLTADLKPEAEQLALSLGAKDFLNKPFKATQIQLRVRNLLQTRFLHLALQEQNRLLESKVRERTVELETARLDVIERLAMAAEYRDHTTGQHALRVGILAARLGERLGLPAEELELLQRAAPLHDVGKIGIPDEILLKPGKLNDQEWVVMKSHVELGGRLLAESHSKLVQLAELIALTHHERWDGSGYPRGLKGDEIPVVGQIVALADVFDTLTHQRPYKQAWSVEEATAEIQRQRGCWFGPRVVDAFFDILETARSLAA